MTSLSLSLERLLGENTGCMPYNDPTERGKLVLLLVAVRYTFNTQSIVTAKSGLGPWAMGVCEETLRIHILYLYKLFLP